MKLTFKIDDTGMQRALQAYADAVGKEAPGLIADEARLFFKAVMDAAPPKTAGQGKNAIRRSITNAAPEFEEENGWVGRAIKAGDIAMTNKALEKSGRSQRVGNFTPQVHKQARDSSGRVFRRKGNNMLIRKDDLAARERHIKQTNQKSGMLKGALAMILEALNAKSKDKSKIAAYVRKNMARGAQWLGTRFSLNLTGNKPSVRAVTGTHPEAIKAVNRAFKARELSIRKKTKALLAGKAAIVNGRFKILSKL